MPIQNHIFQGARDDHAVSTYGTLVPSYITLHYTLGGTVSGSVNHLNTQGFGYHIIVDRNGDIYQTAPFNQTVRHAGKSNWRGWDSLNDFSIGLCFANYGPCYKQGNGFKNSYNSTIPEDRVVGGSHYNGEKRYQDIYWEIFPQVQVDAALRVVDALVGEYQIRDVVRHDDVSIARKVDTGPALDIAPFHALVGDRSSELIHKFRVTGVPAGDTLTLRSSFSASSSKAGEFQNGDILYVHSRSYRRYNGRMVKSKWCAVSIDGLNRIGFVSMSYLEPV